MKFSSTLLLVALISLTGCQTTKIVTPETTLQDENTMTMQAEDTDSDGDGVPDDIDECPATPKNIMVDEIGCPMPRDLIDKTAMELRVFFKKDSSEVLPKYQLELDKVADQMNKYDNTTMQIEAHTSEDEINQALNALPKNRALMVKNYLILRHGIEPKRLSTFDCGAKAPIAPSDTEEGKSFNRRVYGVATEPENGIAYQQPNDSESGTCVKF